MILPFLIALTIGYLFIVIYLPDIKKNLFLSLGLAVSLGILTLSFTNFLLMLINIESRFSLLLVLLLGFLFLIIKYVKKQKLENNIKIKYDKISFCILITAVLITIPLICLHINREFEGSWDGMFIWNLRTKFFFILNQLGLDWRNFYNPVIDWTHLDYPLALPVYNYANQLIYGEYNTIINIFSALFITFAVLTSIVGSVTEFSNFRNGVTAGVVLIASKPFLWESMTQCADVFLSLFILNAFVLLFLHKKYKNNIFLFLSYFFASSCAFCKNEGILFFIVFVIVNVILVKAVNKKILAVACILPLLCLFYTKIFLYWKSDLFENQSFNIIFTKLFDINRVKMIVENNLYNLLSLYVPLFAMIAAIFTGKKESEYKNLSRAIWITLLVMYCGYFIVYLLSPRDLEWHLTTSSIRLIAQYIPLFIFGIFLSFNCTLQKEN